MTYHSGAHSELQCILDIIHQVLDEEEIYHVCEAAEENPNTYSYASIDHNDHFNFGFVSRQNDGTFVYAAFDPIRANHDEAEGIPEDESRCWWHPADMAMFINFLNGTVSEVMGEFRKKAVVQIDNDTIVSETAPKSS